MLWNHKAHKNWVCNDFSGFMFEVRVQDSEWIAEAIDQETGEILEVCQHSHPIEAMESIVPTYNRITETRNAIQDAETTSTQEASVAEASISL
jgi:hypothetical protein